MSTYSLPQLFERCIDFTEDDYWKSIYLNASKGKFPPCYNIKDGCLMFRHKKRPDKVILPNEDPQLFYEVCDSFFRKTGGLMSEKEKTIQWESKNEVTIPIKWTQIKNISQKRALLDLFIISLIEKYNLSKKEQKQLEHIMNVGLTLQSLSNIKLSPTGKIDEIEGLIFNEEMRVFFFEKSKLKVKKIKVEPSLEYNIHLPEENFFIKHWSKFINNISKTNKTLQDSIYEKLSSSAALPTPVIHH